MRRGPSGPALASRKPSPHAASREAGKFAQFDCRPRLRAERHGLDRLSQGSLDLESCEHATNRNFPPKKPRGSKRSMVFSPRVRRKTFPHRFSPACTSSGSRSPANVRHMQKTISGWTDTSGDINGMVMEFSPFPPMEAPPLEDAAKGARNSFSLRNERIPPRKQQKLPLNTSWTSVEDRCVA